MPEIKANAWMVKRREDFMFDYCNSVEGISCNE
jgi:hypothetical protein